MFPEYGDTATGEDEDQQALDEPADEFGRAIRSEERRVGKECRL